MESALKVYSQSWRDPEKTYKERRFTIRQQLSTMPAHQLQNRINSLNEEIEILKTEIKECEEAIRQLKHGKKPENAYRKFNIHPSLTDTTRNLIERFKAEIEWRKRTAKWVRRERAIYLWEQRLRKTKALKLPILKHQQKTISQKAFTLLKQMKIQADELLSLYENYQKIVRQYHALKQQINQLDFNGLTTYENERWVETSISSDLFRKLNEAFKHIPVDRCFSNLEGGGVGENDRGVGIGQNLRVIYAKRKAMDNRRRKTVKRPRLKRLQTCRHSRQNGQNQRCSFKED